MGIKSLLPYIRSTREITDITAFKGKTILVDASVYMRAYLHSGDGTTEYILARLNEQIGLLLASGITPVYVFDGSGYSRIKIVVAKRAAIHQDNHEKINTLREVIAQKLAAPVGTTDDLADEIISMETKLQSLEARNRYLTCDIIIACKQLFDDRGINYLQAVGEADTLISWIFSHNDPYIPSADAVLSTDGDMLTYGCPILITNIVSSDVDSTCTMYKLDKVLEHLNMTREMFIDFCILCGCDYSSKITGIATKTANAFITKYGAIEEIIKYINNNEKLQSRYPYPPEFLEQYQIARNMFLRHSFDGSDPGKLYVLHDVKKIDKSVNERPVELTPDENYYLNDLCQRSGLL